MRVTATTDAPRATGADTVALGIFEGEDVAHDLDGAPLQALLDSGEAKRGFKKLALTEGKRWLLVGLGARERFDGERARIAAATALARAQETGAGTLCWELPH